MDSTFQAKAQSSPSLFCFPYAGAGASAFASWADLMPPEVELCAVQLPGRESRLREKPFVRLPPLVRAVRESLRPYLHKPFAFFGHSMGALISFELARELRRTLWRWFRRRAWKPSGASFPRPLPRGVAVAMTDLQARIDQWINFKSAAAAEPGAKAAALHARPELGVDCVAPRNETEQTIAGIWQELLGIEPIAVRDNFFRAGRPVATGNRWSRACAPRSKPTCRCAAFSKSRLSPSWRTRSCWKRMDNRAQSPKNRPQWPAFEYARQESAQTK